MPIPVLGAPTSRRLVLGPEQALDGKWQPDKPPGQLSRDVGPRLNRVHPSESLASHSLGLGRVSAHKHPDLHPEEAPGACQKTPAPTEKARGEGSKIVGERERRRREREERDERTEIDRLTY